MGGCWEEVGKQEKGKEGEMGLECKNIIRMKKKLNCQDICYLFKRYL